jgi:Animal haem peroxidase
LTASPHAVHRVARDYCLAPGRRVDAPVADARYGRMFPDLPPLHVDSDVLVRAGEAGGICDSSAVLADLAGDRDEGNGAAGWPFFGQLVAHDITADRSPVGTEEDIDQLRNARSPRMNLEMVYGDGPTGMPFLHDLNDPPKLLTGPSGFDLPRNSQGVALIGDSRNDVHLFVASLHLALLHAHNGLVDRLRADGVEDGALYDAARLALTWHYQWIIVHDLLPRLIDRELIDDVLQHGGRWYAPPAGEAFIPVEFADAAYRFGHGQIRASYRLTSGGPAYPLFPDLIGLGPIPREHRLDWAVLFDFPDHPPAQRAKLLDGRLPASLIGLPHQLTGDTSAAYQSLAVRDLIRGRTTGLPSGEAIAAHLGATVLTRHQIGPGWPAGTPLWFYTLKEAEHLGEGERLGPVAGRIVAEVLLGLLRADSTSFLSADPHWRPSLPHSGPTFGLADLLTSAANRQS